MDEFAALMVTALLLGAAFGIGWIIGLAIRRIRGVDDPDREEKRKSKEQRREDKRNRGAFPGAGPKGRFPPRIPGIQPMRPQERQPPPNQNFYMFFAPRGDSSDSEEQEDYQPGRGPRPGPYGPGSPFP